MMHVDNPVQPGLARLVQFLGGEVPDRGGVL